VIVSINPVLNNNGDRTMTNKSNHNADMTNANKGTPGTNKTYDKDQGHRGSQMNPQKPTPPNSGKKK